jgi:4-aminobutyrate aminotransferase / (S)-3-amino-2-methylpropionate transaminase / 5-aminovalerate transaminase
LKMIRQPDFLAHANRLGNVMREVLLDWKRQWPIVGDVRGLGPMLLIELVSDPVAKTPLRPEETLAIIRQAVAKGVVLIRAGVYSNCIRFLPPLNMPEDMLREALKAVGSAIESVTQAKQEAVGTR